MIEWWRDLFSRSFHHWGWGQTLRFAVLFCLMASLVSGAMYTGWQWWQLVPALKTAFTSHDFLVTLATYTVLFFIFGLGATLFYLFAMGWVVLWMGRVGHIVEMDYARCCRVVLVSGLPLLVLVLVFGQMLNLSAAVAAMLMVGHALWIHSMELPPPLPADAEGT